MAAQSITLNKRVKDRVSRLGSPKALAIMSALILGLGFYVVYPVLLIFINSFNIAADVFEQPRYGLDNWRLAFSQPELWQALANTFLVYFAYTSISFPTSVLIAWILARTRIRFSHGLEFLFWVSFMLPGLATTIGWIFMLDPDIGLLNRLVFQRLPFVETGFNVFSVQGIILVHLMGNAISQKVMLLTPAFRNMDAALEEAATVSGASTMRTMLRVTLPVMIPPMLVVFLLNIVRIFNSFETELLLGAPIGFFVYSTKIYDLVRASQVPQYGQAAALASITMLLIALIIPLQRWLLGRRRYTTVTGSLRPTLISLGPWQWPVNAFVGFVLLLLIPVPVFALVFGTFMTRIGWFNVNEIYTLNHWTVVLSDPFFLRAARNTFMLAMSAAIVSPLLFSVVAYVLVRTNWRGRGILDSIVWVSAAIPGMLSGLGLLWMFLGTPFLVPLYGTLTVLVLVVILQGKLTGIQLFKSTFLQMGQEMEEAARISGAGWWRTYVRIWIPLIMPTMLLIGVLNFVLAANTTSSIILLASRGTVTLSILSLEWMMGASGGRYEQAGVISVVITVMTIAVALIARKFGLALGVRRR